MNHTPRRGDQHSQFIRARVNLDKKNAAGDISQSKYNKRTKTVIAVTKRASLSAKIARKVGVKQRHELSGGIKRTSNLQTLTLEGT